MILVPSLKRNGGRIAGKKEASGEASFLCFYSADYNENGLGLTYTPRGYIMRKMIQKDLHTPQGICWLEMEKLPMEEAAARRNCRWGNY